MRVAVAILAVAVCLAGCGAERQARSSPPGHVRHVFTIVLENKDYAQTFGAGSPAPYLTRELVADGTLLREYSGIGHHSLTDYVAMVSGQPPNPATQDDCPVFTDVVDGRGCVYPETVQTIADQLEANGLSWRGYMEDMGADPAREAATCAHPPVGAPDPAQTATATDQYATRHNPFVYFHSIIDDQARCDANVVPLDRLAGDLRQTATTPNYVFVTPDLCHDGHDDACADGSPGGYAGIDGFLRTWVPRITASPAFRADGLLIVTFDEAEDDNSGCCGTPGGGGRVGALLLGPDVRPGAVVDTPVNHYGYLRSIEDLFGLPRLGHAAQGGLATFQSAGAIRARGG